MSYLDENALKKTKEYAYYCVSKWKLFTVYDIKNEKALSIDQTIVNTLLRGRLFSNTVYQFLHTLKKYYEKYQALPDMESVVHNIYF